MEPSYLFIYKHSIHELFRMKENDICHIACVKRYLYNNNLFPANLEQLIIMTEVTTCIHALMFYINILYIFLLRR